MLKNPKVSVVMAAYNGGEYIGSSIESILNQTFGDFEFVIVNDCSTDNTLDIIKGYNDPRIVIVNNETNLGQTKSLNIGIKHAKGEYVARIDADDLSYPRRLESQLKFLKNNPEFDIVGTSGHILTKSGKIRGTCWAPIDQREIFFRIFVDNPIIHVSAFMKRDKVLMLGGYDESFNITQDYDLWSRFLINKMKLANLRDVLVGYRIYGGSFGRNEGYIKRISEFSEILYRNIRAFTDIRGGRDAVYNLRRICISPVSAELSCKECEDMINLFFKIFANLKPEFKININKQLIEAAVGKFQHNIGMAMLRKGELPNARHMFVNSIKNKHPSLLPYAGYLLTFFNLSIRKRILDLREGYIIKVSGCKK